MDRVCSSRLGNPTDATRIPTRRRVRRISYTRKEIQGVTFEPNHIVYHLHDIPTAADMTSEEKLTSWYSVDELSVFKDEVRAACRLLRGQSGEVSEPTSQQIQHELLPNVPNWDSKLECTRGLELRSSPERIKRKYTAMKLILEYQRRLRLRASSEEGFATQVGDPCSHLALVSSRATRWSTNVATATAKEDYSAAYPEHARFADKLVSSVNNLGPILGKRRDVLHRNEKEDLQNLSKKRKEGLTCQLNFVSALPNCT